MSAPNLNPKSAEELRASAAARKRRQRERDRAQKSAANVVDHALGLLPGTTAAAKPAGVSTEDYAKMLRDRMNKVVGALPDEALLIKDFAPGIKLGLDAQKVLDARERTKTKQGNAELGLALIEWLTRPRGGYLPEATVRVLNPTVVEGEAVELAPVD